MKTQQEIKKMKDEIQKKIDEYAERMARTNNVEKLITLGDRNHQLMAQYNILLEVLR